MIGRKVVFDYAQAMLQTTGRIKMTPGGITVADGMSGRAPASIAPPIPSAPVRDSDADSANDFDVEIRDVKDRPAHVYGVLALFAAFSLFVWWLPW